MAALGLKTSCGAVASSGVFGFPLVLRQNVILSDLCMLGFSELRLSEREHKAATVHFFESDDKFDEVWNDPPRYIQKLSQYRQVLSPDFSQYTDMPKAVQIFNIYRNRWCAAFWQKSGLVVIPTITWSDADSLEYSFDAIEKNSCVAVSTVGCVETRDVFMEGYEEMVKKLDPRVVICYGKPFADMQKYAKLIEIEYSINTRVSHIVGG